MSKYTQIAAVLLIVLAGCSGFGGQDPCAGTLEADKAIDVLANATVYSHERVTDNQYIAEALNRSDPSANKVGSVHLSESETAQVMEKLADLSGDRVTTYVQYENTTMEIAIYCPL